MWTTISISINFNSQKIFKSSTVIFSSDKKYPFASLCLTEQPGKIAKARTNTADIFLSCFILFGIVIL